MKNTPIKIHEWVQKRKVWLIKNLPTYDDDRIAHYKVVRIFTLVFGLFGLGLPREMFFAMSGLLIFTILIELPSLVVNKFSYKSLDDSFKDFAMGVIAGGLVWLYLGQKFLETQ